MKRKHEEGYALVFALVVLLFLSVVAMSMMQLTGRDLNAQIASVDRMKAQYAAQGELEKIIGKLENNTGINNLNSFFGEAEITIQGAVAGTASMIADIKVPSADRSVIVSCSLRLTGNFIVDGTNTVELNGACIVDYLSYEITPVGGVS